MKIAIHHRQESFSERWIEHCQNHKIDYKLVNCYDSDIVDQMKDCDVLMWHWHHEDPKAVLFAKQLTYSLEAMGKTVFPDSKSIWHFDDKVGQKYLMEAIGAPLIPSTVFYDKDKALAWAALATYPQVFKLRGGAGSRNVSLVRSESEARSKINQAFGRGFKAIVYFPDLKLRAQRARKSGTLWEKLRQAPRQLKRLWTLNHYIPCERGYALFQDFIPGNQFDTRVVVIGERAFGLRRYCRENDFRASGSGAIAYEAELISKECLEISFAVTEKLQMQCCAFDFIKTPEGTQLIAEISYGFAMKAYDKCPGYWDRSLGWHPGSFNPQAFMIEDICQSIQARASR